MDLALALDRDSDNSLQAQIFEQNSEHDPEGPT